MGGKSVTAVEENGSLAMTCRSRTPEFCRKSRQPQAYCCVQPSRGGQQADLHSEGLRKRAKNILSRFASLFITQ